MISAVFAATTTAVTVSDASQDCCGKANVDSAKLFFAEEEDEKRGSTSMEVIRTARGLRTHQTLLKSVMFEVRFRLI